jgi:hypothetical protein
MLHRRWRRNRRWAPGRVMTVAADKAYDTRDFVSALRGMNILGGCLASPD